MARKKKQILELQIETIAKKMNIFSLNDIEVLLEKNKVEIIPILEKMVNKNKLKYEDNSYIYIPDKIVFAKNENIIDNREHSLIHCLPFRPKKPKEVYLRHINEMDGFVDYFFAPQHIKNKIQRILKVLKEAHGSTKAQLDEILRKNKMSIDTYHKYKREICANGLVNIVGSMTEEPGEIFHFYKEYYLSPKQLSSEEAHELAIQRFERLIKLRINRSKITSSEKMLKWLENEYSKNEIKKFRTYNFSEFDVEHMYHE